MLGKLGTLSSFQVTCLFKEELNKMKVFCLKCYVLTKLCLYSGDLNNELVRYSSGWKQSDRWMVYYSSHCLNIRLLSGIWITDFIGHLNMGLFVQYSSPGLNTGPKSLLFKWLQPNNLLSLNLSFSLDCFIHKHNLYVCIKLSRLH